MRKLLLGENSNIYQYISGSVNSVVSIVRFTIQFNLT